MNQLLTYDDAYRLFDEHMHKENTDIKERETCDECGGKMKQTSQDLMACIKCGLCELEVFEEKSYMEFGEYQPRRTLYKRRLYCINKLLLICGIRHSRSPYYSKVLAALKDLPFETVTELKNLMKTNKLSAFYKYIYAIWNDIKGTRLISLTDMEIVNVTTRFIELEGKFKQSEEHKRKNIFCYNSMIYTIMKEMNKKGFEHILLPNNHVHLERIIKNICTSII